MEHISKHSDKNLQTCWTPWSTQETRGLPVLTPVPAFHTRACLNLHHSDIQGTAQKSHCVNTFGAIAKKNKVCHCLGAWAGHQRTRQQRDTTHGTTETTEGRCDMMMVVHFCFDSARSSAVHEAQSDAPLQVRHPRCRRRSWRHVNQLRHRRRVWHGRVVFVV